MITYIKEIISIKAMTSMFRFCIFISVVFFFVYLFSATHDREMHLTHFDLFSIGNDVSSVNPPKIKDWSLVLIWSYPDVEPGSVIIYAF